MAPRFMLRLMSSRTFRLGLLVVASGLLSTAEALAHPAVDQAMEAYRVGDVRGALAKAERAATIPALTEEELVQVHWLRARCSSALGREAQTAEALDVLLRLRPLFEPERGEAPPDLRQLLRDRAQERQRELGIVLDGPRLRGARVMVRVSGHPERVHHVTLYARSKGEVSYRPFPLKLDGERAIGLIGDAPLWQAAGSAGAMEVVVEAQNANDVPLARLGHGAEPLAVPVDANAAGDAIKAIEASGAAREDQPAGAAKVGAESTAEEKPEAAAPKSIAGGLSAFTTTGTVIAAAVPAGLIIVLFGLVSAAFPPLYLAFPVVALAAVAATGAAGWLTATFFARRRVPFLPALVAAAIPAAVCMLPGAGCCACTTLSCQGIVLYATINSAISDLRSGVIPVDLPRDYAMATALAGCGLFPLLASVICGNVIGAPLVALVEVWLGQPNDDGDTHFDLLRVPELEADDEEE